MCISTECEFCWVKTTVFSTLHRAGLQICLKKLNRHNYLNSVHIIVLKFLIWHVSIVSVVTASLSHLNFVDGMCKSPTTIFVPK